MSRNESKLNEIPYGLYCYTIKEIVNDDRYGYRIRTKLCPYFVYLDEGKKKCLLMNVDSEEDFGLDEHLKICGINEIDEEV